MALPGDLRLRDHPGDQAGVEPERDERSTERPNSPLEHRCAEDRAEVAEDDPACADVQAGPTEQPGRAATDHDRDGGDPRPVPHATHGDEPAERQERNRVRRKVAEIGVQERRPHDPVEPGDLARSQAMALETIVEGDGVDKLDHPHQQDPADQQPDRRPHESRQRGAGFGGGGHRLMLRLVGRWIPADAAPERQVIQY